MGLAFDALFWLIWALVHAAAAAAALAVGAALWGAALWQQALALVVAYAVFLHAFVLTLGLLKRALQPPLREGVCAVGPNRDYLAWGLNSAFQGVFTTSWVAPQVHILFTLRWLHYRLHGMRLHLSNIIGTRAVIRQAELVTLGPGAVVGEEAFLSCHLNTDGRHHLQAAIRVGARSVVGARVMVGPGVTIGARSVIGGGSGLYPHVTVGDDVRVGPGAMLKAGARVGDGATILATAVLEDGAVVGPGEIWGGHPAVRLQG
jgi:acetyltransferase-like isoleucine patch superfamily enzyme